MTHIHFKAGRSFVLLDCSRCISLLLAFHYHSKVVFRFHLLYIYISQTWIQNDKINAKKNQRVNTSSWHCAFLNNFVVFYRQKRIKRGEKHKRLKSFIINNLPSGQPHCCVNSLIFSLHFCHFSLTSSLGRPQMF